MKGVDSKTPPVRFRSMLAISNTVYKDVCVILGVSVYSDFTIHTASQC